MNDEMDETQQDAADQTDPFREMMRKMGDANPRMAMMAELMGKFRERENAVNEREALKKEIGALRAELEKLGKTNRVLKKRYDAILQGHLSIMQVIEPIASALGACPHCLGMVAECRECGGTGKAGAYMPLLREFEEFCRPAAARLGLSFGRKEEKTLLASENRPSRPNQK